MDNFNFDDSKKVSAAASGLVKWVLGVVEYNKVSKTMKSKIDKKDEN